MMYGWIEWRGLRASRQGWTPWTLQDRQGRQSADASFELLLFLEEGCDCSYHLQGCLVTGRQYHGVRILITHYEVKAGQNLPAYPDHPLYFRQNFPTFDLTFNFTIALPALIQALDDIAGQSLLACLQDPCLGPLYHSDWPLEHVDFLFTYVGQVSLTLGVFVEEQLRVWCWVGRVDEVPAAWKELVPKLWVWVRHDWDKHFRVFS